LLMTKHMTWVTPSQEQISNRTITTTVPQHLLYLNR
jgi:hypothetical protein